MHWPTALKIVPASQPRPKNDRFPGASGQKLLTNLLPNNRVKRLRKKSQQPRQKMAEAQ